MAKVFEQIIPHLVGGISQQPGYLRHPSTSQEEVNTCPTFSQGLKKRPPTLHQAQLTHKISDTVSTHIVSFLGKLFLMMIDDGKLLIWDEEGKARKVTLREGSEAYLRGTRFHCLPNEDMAYIVNKSKKVAMSTRDGSPPDGAPREGALPRDESPFSGLVFCRQFVPDAEYKIEILVEGEEEQKITASSKTKSKKELQEEIDRLKAEPPRVVYRDRDTPRGGHRGSQLLPAKAGRLDNACKAD